MQLHASALLNHSTCWMGLFDSLKVQLLQNEVPFPSLHLHTLPVECTLTSTLFSVLASLLTRHSHRCVAQGALLAASHLPVAFHQVPAALA